MSDHYENNSARSGGVVHTGSKQPPAGPALKPIEKFGQQLDTFKAQLKSVLPPHISIEKFNRIVLTAVQMNQDLLDADRKSLFTSCLKCANDGLLPDGREAALVIYKTKSKDKDTGRDVWTKAVQYLPMIAGIQKRVRNSKSIASLQGFVIHEFDSFIWRQGLDPTLEHTPKFPGERGAMIGAYAVARFKDVDTPPMFDVMDANQIAAVRSVSRSAEYGPWAGPFADQMWIKSVVKRLSKSLATSSDIEDLLPNDNDDETLAIAAPAAPATRHVSRLEALEGTVIDDLTGEVTTDASREADAAAGAAAEAERIQGEIRAAKAAVAQAAAQAKADAGKAGNGQAKANGAASATAATDTAAATATEATTEATTEAAGEPKSAPASHGPDLPPEDGQDEEHPDDQGEHPGSDEPDWTPAADAAPEIDHARIWADELISKDFAGAKTEADLKAVTDITAVNARFARYQTERPEIFAMLRLAYSRRVSELKAAAKAPKKGTAS